MKDLVLIILKKQNTRIIEIKICQLISQGPNIKCNQNIYAVVAYKHKKPPA